MVKILEPKKSPVNTSFFGVATLFVKEGCAALRA
jgi:hypothetical protein